jgi:MarR family transcriptional regulator, organic hydroperoxide resistance regulator
MLTTKKAGRVKDTVSEDKAFEFWVLLARTRDAMENARKLELMPLNISPVQAFVLFTILNFKEEVTPATLSRLLYRESQTVSELLTRMEKSGLIKKVKGSSPRNRVKITITEKGRRLYEQSARRESIHTVVSALSEKELYNLTASLAKLRQSALQYIRSYRAMEIIEGANSSKKAKTFSIFDL